MKLNAQTVKKTTPFSQTLVKGMNPFILQAMG